MNNYAARNDGFEWMSLDDFEEMLPAEIYRDLVGAPRNRCYLADIVPVAAPDPLPVECSDRERG
jgi:hypothetical protein